MSKIHIKIFRLMIDKDITSVVDLAEALDMEYQDVHRALTVACSRAIFMRIRKFLGKDFEPELIWNDHGKNHDPT